MSYEKIHTVLNDFEPISLKEMDSVKLMDRTDTKFIFHIKQLPEILNEIRPFYRSLEVGGIRMSKYETLYYDTDDFELYTRHHCGKMNRYKVRSRKYVESNLNFFEVKYKNNKGRTIKNRIKTSAIEQTLSENAKVFLGSHSELDPDQLKPRIWINYTRITLVNKKSAERLTIDIGLHFMTGTGKNDLSDLVIAEVKQDKMNSLSPILEVMRKKRIQIGSISKYCFGIVSMYPGLRKNNFKEKIRQINKLLYAA